ncbi:transposase [Streptomyces sp. NPDC056160]|uniref:transposase n=1 Tax=Streptomyces sp. NPDC056160 TaxID=3345731 RepID=UPI0035E0E2FA
MLQRLIELAPYTSPAFADVCRQAGVRQSMSAIGSSADNALAESFNATFKREILQGRKHWSSEREARTDAFRRLNRYNTRRRHSHLGQRSPITYERALDTTSTTLAQAAQPVSKIPGQRPVSRSGCWSRACRHVDTAARTVLWASSTARVFRLDPARIGERGVVMGAPPTPFGQCGASQGGGGRHGGAMASDDNAARRGATPREPGVIQTRGPSPPGRPQGGRPRQRHRRHPGTSPRPPGPDADPGRDPAG